MTESEDDGPWCIMGIDPGMSGAIAFFYPEQDRVAVYDMPSANNVVSGAEVARIVNAYAPKQAIIEAVHAMPGQGVSSTFKFGQSYGIAIGAVSACMIPLHFVTPQRWKKHYRLGADKDEGRARAISLWPACQHFARKKDHGRAEAALLARFLHETS
jgi:crossover junction endodeoxyribonuclease RuvC